VERRARPALRCPVGPAAGLTGLRRKCSGRRRDQGAPCRGGSGKSCGSVEASAASTLSPES
jgi:hypothetical protein